MHDRRRLVRTGSALPARLGDDGLLRQVTIADLARHAQRPRNVGQFRPGLPVTILLERGHEERGLLSWTEEKIVMPLLESSEEPQPEHQLLLPPPDDC
jgi:hypothetical protein